MDSPEIQATLGTSYKTKTKIRNKQQIQKNEQYGPHKKDLLESLVIHNYSMTSKTTAIMQILIIVCLYHQATVSKIL